MYGEYKAWWSKVECSTKGRVNQGKNQEAGSGFLMSSFTLGLVHSQVIFLFQSNLPARLTNFY